MDCFQNPNIADRLASEKYFQGDDFLESHVIDQLEQHCLSEWERGAFHMAGIGAGNAQVVPSVRKDFVLWWDPQALSALQLPFWSVLQSIADYLNRFLFLGIQTFETHYSIYEPGCFYAKHIDRFKHSNNRQISMTFYLNRNWQEVDGGCLRLYFDGRILDIAPLANRLVLFVSEGLEHEVLVTHRRRLTITTWFKNREWPLR